MSIADDGAFSAGDPVRVARVHPPGHRRTPFYVRGKVGFIERCCGAHPNPEELAYGWSGTPPKRLYRVRFRQREIWPDYSGEDEDTIDVDIYEHWLKPLAANEHGGAGGGSKESTT